MTKFSIMRIDLLQAGLKNDYIFQISNASTIYLSSSDYQDRKACLTQLQEVLANLRDNEQIAIQSGNNKKYYFEVLDHAQSPSFDDIEAASDILAKLKDYANSKNEFKINYQKQGEQVVSKKQLGLREELYNFDKISKSQQAGFELIEEEENKGRFFHFNDETGNVLLYSRMYDGKNRRIKAIQDLIKNCKEEQRFQLVQQDGEHYFIFKTKDGFEIGRSRMFENQSQMETAIAFLRKEASNAKNAFKLQKKKKKKKKQAKEKYHLKQLAPLGLVGFEGFKSKKNKLHYFHYHDEGGQALLYSKPFEKRKLRDAAIAGIIKTGGKKKAYKTWKKSKDQYYFSVIDKKGKSFARSRYFTTKKEMIAALKHLQSNVGGYEQEVNVVPITKEKQLTIHLPEVAKDEVEKTAAVAVTTAIAAETIPEVSIEEVVVEADAPETVEEISVPETREQPDVIDTILPQPGVKIETEPAVESISTKVSNPPIPEPVFESKAPFRKEIIEEKPSKGFPWKWIILLLALGLAALLFKMCGGEETKTQATPPAPVTKVAPPKKEPVEPAKLGPTALELALTSNTAEARIADFLSLPEVTVPKVFILESVQFPFSSAELTNTSFAQLDNVVKVLNAYPKAKIAVNGHTDSRGDDAMNLVLSENRAKAVQTYLLSKGIDSERIIRAVGFGETDPIATNETEEGRQENRRSELVVVER